MKYIIAIIIFFCSSISLFAQNNKGLLVGRVLDSLGKKSLELANITIYKLGDITEKKKVLTDKNGIFKVNGLSSDTRLKVIISYTGYRDYHQEFSFDEKQFVDLGEIRMKVHSMELDTVTVQAQA